MKTVPFAIIQAAKEYDPEAVNYILSSAISATKSDEKLKK